MMKHRVIRDTWYERRPFWKFSVVLLILLVVPRTTYLVWASFEDAPVGGRGLGVDGAMTTIADDVYTLYYNPAGAAFLSKPEVGMQWGSLYGGLTDNSNLSQGYLAGVYPMHGEAIGLSYNVLNLTSLYKEETFGLSYARRLTENFSVGMTGKNYRKTVGHDFNTENAELNGVARQGVSDPVFLNGHVADAWGGDAAALYRIGNGWQTGFSVRNLNEPNVALGSGDKDPVSRTWDWGVARQWNHHAAMLDMTRERFTEMETRLHAGLETWIMGGHIGMRGGGGYGERGYRQMTAGLSYRLNFMQFDYGFMLPLGSIEGTTGDQQLSLLFRFGTTPAPPILQSTAKQEPLMDLNDLLRDNVEPSTHTMTSEARDAAADLIISPDYVMLMPGESQQFKAQVTGQKDPRLSWSFTPQIGTLTQTGIYQAPDKVLFAENVWITAKNESKSGRYERAVVHLHSDTDGPVTVKLSLGWNTGEFVIQPAYVPVIAEVAKIMSLYPQTNAVIRGFPDDRGSTEAKQILSNKRANAVRDTLISLGIRPRRVTVKDFDPSPTSASDPSAESRRIHRWVEAVLSTPEVPASTVPDAEINP
jgi:outer membrane protein OmpA-like peptidoglycan-associated protein